MMRMMSTSISKSISLKLVVKCIGLDVSSWMDRFRDLAFDWMTVVRVRLD